MPSSSLQALLARAGAALERGQGAEAAQLLAPALRSSTLTRDDELAVRAMLAEAWLLQDDLDQAASALGRPPDTFRDTVAPGGSPRSGGCTAASRSRAAISRARSRCTAARSSTPKPRTIRAPSVWPTTSSRQCYRQVGDTAIVREHITKAASALHAAGDRRHLALVHSLSSILLAQVGAYDEAMAALRQAERLAATGAGRRRARDRVQQPGQRDDDAAPPRAGARARRAQRGAAGSARIGPRPRRRARHARPDLRPPRRSRPAPSTCCTARSRCAARSSSTRRPAPCSTRSRRST